MSLRLATAFLLATLSAAVGCAQEKPPSAELTTAAVVAGQSADDADEVAAEDATEPSAPQQVCVPKAEQECRVYRTTESGGLNCYPSIQICKSDGSGWHDCADFEGAARDPLPASSDAGVVVKAD